MSRNAGSIARKSPPRLLVAAVCSLLLPGFLAGAADPPGLKPRAPAAPETPRARVVSVSDPEATTAFRANPEVVRRMVDAAILRLTGKTTVSNAWLSLVSTQDVVGLKLFTVPGPNSGTRPAVVAAVVEGLLAAGLPSNHVVLWDRDTTDLRLAGYYGLAERYHVRITAATREGYDPAVAYDSTIIGNLVFNDLEFGQTGPKVGRKSYVTRLLTKDLTKVINISPLLNHNLSGTSGHLYSLAIGSVDNVLRFEADPDRLPTAVPEIYALQEVGDKVVLNITDALICQYEGTERTLLHYSRSLNALWFSRDPVALDVLAMRELDRYRSSAGTPRMKARMEIYNNAALLELGVTEPSHIEIDRVVLKPEPDPAR